ncbi:M48 family metalloprotease [Candidatus Gracilibacteria bacterium]|nr:M48 family metalloprotease [Candidatus Gracilibacteria bacterium]
MKIITPKKLSKNHNVSTESDSSLVVRYIGFFLFLIFGIYVFFWSLSFVVVQFVSIEDEKNFLGLDVSDIDLGTQVDLPQELADRYKDIGYNLQLIDMGDTQNAFASLGGNLYITTAFLEQIETYEELDFVVGHEIGHIENRDVLRNLVSKFPVIIILSIFGGDYGLILFEGIIGNTHSKIHETRADYFGLDFVQSRNGHVGCALNFFEKGNTIEGNMSEIFSTHPVTDLRIERAKKYIYKQGYTQSDCTSYKQK